MAPSGLTRKLAAILSADVVGYSRLMHADEAGTVRRVQEYKGAMSELIRQHRGRVVDSPGDNLLAEFASVVDAVQCAVAVQKGFQDRNAALPEDRRMQFRIGINLGDVIEEGEQIFGDGVNIAARLEGLAEPGGICISASAYEQIEDKLPIHCEYLGEHVVKNISKPIRAYRARMQWEGKDGEKVVAAGGRPGWDRRMTIVLAISLLLVLAIVVGGYFTLRPAPSPPEKADPKKMAHPLPDKPSIAVLPFVNMSEDVKQDFFSDGMTEEIITALSKVSQSL
jgi:class 3 adenylate cyclase